MTQPPSPTDQGRAHRVALVDDDPMWRYLTCTALRERGWDVLDCASGTSLLDALAQRPADIVVIDATGPHSEGFETCRRVRALAGAELPALLVGGHEDESSIRRAYESGADDYFIRSTHWTLLAERMRHLVRRSGTARQAQAERAARERLERLASHDPLTGLPNRTRFVAALDAAIGAAALRDERVAVAVLDLDRFTQVNETLGQTAGDELLGRIAERVRESLSIGPGEAGEDAPMLARLPGDEFALMLPRVTSISEVDECIRRAMTALRRPFRVADTDCFVSASAGIALFPRDSDSAGTLLARADRAVREVKARGRNDAAWYLPSLNRDPRARMDIVAGLHKALDRSEFELHYQPCVDVGQGRVTGMEALLRWRRDGRLVPPGEFIPVAEDTGLIVPIGEWVLQTAAERLAAWRRAGLAVERIAVNVPTIHFERESLLSTLRAAMHVHRLAPRSLELELTETCMVRDFERTLPRIEALIGAGATLAIDDFGTGYSSLAYLTRLPIDKLKVDRAFVNQLGASRQGGAVCRAIVALGQSLGVQVLAEGVETVEQAGALLALGCRSMQGFLFSRPVPAEHVHASIAAAQSVARRITGTGVPRARPAPVAPAAAALAFQTQAGEVPS